MRSTRSASWEMRPQPMQRPTRPSSCNTTTAYVSQHTDLCHHPRPNGGSMTDCIFCRIVSGEIPSTNVYRDEHVTAFRDINPAAPTHILIVPNRHIDSVNVLTAADEQLVGHLFVVAGQLAAQEGFAEKGY